MYDLSVCLSVGRSFFKYILHCLLTLNIAFLPFRQVVSLYQLYDRSRNRYQAEMYVRKAVFPNPSFQNVMKFNKTVNTTVLVGYNVIIATRRFVGYLYIQRAFVEYLLNYRLPRKILLNSAAPQTKI